NETRWPIAGLAAPRGKALMWTKISCPPSVGSMKPKPRSSSQERIRPSNRIASLVRPNVRVQRPPKAVRCNDLLFRVRMFDVPPGEDQHTRVALQRARKNLCAFHAKPNTIVLDGRDRRLGDPREGGEVVLAQLLKLPHD